MLQLLYNETNHSCWEEEFLKTVQTQNIQVNGNVINMQKNGKCFFMAPIDAAEQQSCKFTFLSGDVDSAVVSLGYVYCCFIFKIVRLFRIGKNDTDSKCHLFE